MKRVGAIACCMTFALSMGLSQATTSKASNRCVLVASAVGPVRQACDFRTRTGHYDLFVYGAPDVVYQFDPRGCRNVGFGGRVVLTRCTAQPGTVVHVELYHYPPTIFGVLILLDEPALKA